ncbi:MAG: hypothetical protein K8R90_11430 [Candidatus Cloacimonetes bacterium]|nr:hypothetical protein [Candidatus Cloacimonadota bacterium]
MTGRTNGAIALCLLLLACAGQAPDAWRGAEVVWTPLLTIALDEPATKACYDPLHNTLYVLLPQSNAIGVYVDGERVNTLGGLGYGETQFSRLADIALGPDRKLLALDSFRAQIKRFDHRGDLIGVIQLEELSDPRLLAVSTGGFIYIWDAVRRDITLITDPPAEEPYRFGRFQLDQPSLLDCTANYVWAWDDGQTVFFSAMGQYVQTLDGLLHTDRSGRRFRLHESFVQPLPEGDPFAVSSQPWQRFLLHDGYMSLISAHRLLLGRLEYATP